MRSIEFEYETVNDNLSPCYGEMLNDMKITEITGGIMDDAHDQVAWMQPLYVFFSIS